MRGQQKENAMNYFDKEWEKHNELIYRSSDPKIKFTKITPRLYLSGEPCKSDVLWLVSKGIKNVLSVAKECHDTCIGYGDALKLVHVGFRDHVPMEPWLVLSAMHTLKAMLKNGPTLVHCGVGISRSPTTIALYWYAKGITNSIEEGVQKLVEKRPCVAPNKIVDEKVIEVVEDLRAKWAKSKSDSDATTTLSGGVK
jgi:protein-tyrosine phosphatase